MRVLMNISFPVHEFNRGVSDRSVGVKIKAILDEIKAEAVYFTERFGQWAAVMVVNLANASQVPALAEPWFLNFNASVEFHIAMTPGERNEAGLEALGKKCTPPIKTDRGQEICRSAYRNRSPERALSGPVERLE